MDQNNLFVLFYFSILHLGELQRTCKCLLFNTQNRPTLLYKVHKILVKYSMYSRVQWFSTFILFYHMGAFHEWDSLVRRPFVKKKNSRTPQQVDAHTVFKTRRATGSLRIRAGFGNSGNIFTKDQRILEKTKIQNLFLNL